MNSLREASYSTKQVALVLGVPEQRLHQARVVGKSRYNVDLPPHVDLGSRRIRYRVGDLLAWSRRTGKPLRFDALPVSLVVRL